jgi:hypothetical protein
MRLLSISIIALLLSGCGVTHRMWHRDPAVARVVAEYRITGSWHSDSSGLVLAVSTIPLLSTGALVAIKLAHPDDWRAVDPVSGRADEFLVFDDCTAVSEDRRIATSWGMLTLPELSTVPALQLRAASTEAEAAEWAGGSAVAGVPEPIAKLPVDSVAMDRPAEKLRVLSWHDRPPAGPGVTLGKSLATPLTIATDVALFPVWGLGVLAMLLAMPGGC